MDKVITDTPKNRLIIVFSIVGKTIIEVMKDRRFIILSLVLLISACGIHYTAQAMQLHFRKERVDLRKKLQEFDTGKMWPYKLVRKEKITSEVEEALGTKDYLQLGFEDTRVRSENDFGRYVNFFVTYYTGDPDQVPHVPDVCYLGGGWDPGGENNTVIKLPGLGLPDNSLPIRVLFFKNSRGMAPMVQTVIYFFSVNGAFVEERMGVRLHLADIRLKYAYFSKVEISTVTQEIPPKEKVTELAQQFLARALPILMQEHWADWKEVIKK
jgi:hypothetical protein